jgi:hypothetical protein
VCRFVYLGPAMRLAVRLTQTVAAKRGFVERVIITDGGDETCFEWQHGKGVTFK